MQNIQGALKNDLIKFGLNPAEWTIEPMEDQIYQVAHVEDQHFYFLGEVQVSDSRPEWKGLHLFSL